MGKAEYSGKGGKPKHARFVRLARKVAYQQLKRHPEYRKLLHVPGELSSEQEMTDEKVKFGDILKGSTLPDSLPIRDIAAHLSDLRGVPKEIVS